jgi:hypothetical protein
MHSMVRKARFEPRWSAPEKTRPRLHFSFLSIGTNLDIIVTGLAFGIGIGIVLDASWSGVSWSPRPGRWARDGAQWFVVGGLGICGGVMPRVTSPR